MASPTTSKAPKMECRRAVLRSIIDSARTWPEAPSSEARSTQTKTGRLSTTSRRRHRQQMADRGQPDDEIRSGDQADVQVVRGLRSNGGR